MERSERETKSSRLDDNTSVRMSYQQASSPASETSQPDSDKVTVYWGDILPLLADAVKSKRSWVQDFDGDQVVISRDFHEVLCAYRRYRGNLSRPDSNLQVDKAA